MAGPLLPTLDEATFTRVQLVAKTVYLTLATAILIGLVVFGWDAMSTPVVLVVSASLIWSYVERRLDPANAGRDWDDDGHRGPLPPEARRPR